MSCKNMEVFCSDNNSHKDHMRLPEKLQPGVSKSFHQVFNDNFLTTSVKMQTAKLSTLIRGIGGSKVGGGHQPPSMVQILSFPCSFPDKLGKIIGWQHPFWG